MEIHPPHRPITSIKEFLRELLTITAGILIALSLEGMLEWNHHREMVHEARANIVSELRENQKELAKEQQDLQKMQNDVLGLIGLVHKLEENRKTPVNQFNYIWSVAELHSTSWHAASTTGAIAYMPYAEVKRYTEMYDLQNVFEGLQQRSLSSSLEVEGLGTLLQRNTQTITTAELSDAERRLGIAMANVQAMQQLSQPLNQRYEQVLKAASE